MKRRLLSAFLAAMLVLTMAPVAFAAEGNGTAETSEYVAEINGTGYATLQTAIDAAKAGDTITLLKDITVDGEDKDTSRTVIDKPITLDLNDKTIKSPDNMGNNDHNFVALYISADVTINATTGGINTGTNGAYAINIMNGATLTINGGNYYGGGTAVQVQKGTANINGGTFACEPYSDPTYGYKFLINCVDSAYKNGTAKVSIKGGSFVNYDPSGSASENPIVNFCPSGYVAVKGVTENVPVWTVEDHRVAEVGNTGYSTLADAVAAANNGDTVTLLTNTAEDITIAQDKNIILDLNGKKLTNVASHTIFNNGTLTINGEGTVDNVTHGTAALYNKGTVVVNGGTFDRSEENGQNKGESGQNSWYTIKNVGTMTIKDGVTVQTAGNNTALGKFSSLVSNGYFDSGDYTANKGIDQPTLTINGGLFRGGLNTIKNDDRAKITIVNGTFTNYYQAVVMNHNVAEIEGGTFTAASDADSETYGIYNCGCAVDIDLGTLTVSGGTFTGATYAVADVSSEPAVVTISDGKFAGTKAAIVKSRSSKASISISGGDFSSDPTAYLARYTGTDGQKYVAGAINESPYFFRVALVENNQIPVVPAVGCRSECGGAEKDWHD